MAKLRFHLAVIAAKCVQLAIRMLGRNASHNPGVMALKICPNFMAMAPKAPLVICVTGTNGKTTVSNLLTDALIADGRRRRVEHPKRKKLIHLAPTKTVHQGSLETNPKIKQILREFNGG